MSLLRVLFPVTLCLLAAAPIPLAAQIRVGIVGTDTSHVPAFTRMLNDPSAPGHVPGARVVAAFKGGSPDVESSASRVDKFAAEIQEKWGVEIVPDIPTLCAKVDAVLLESVDGRTHLPQARQIIAAGKPFFIDKPMASTLEDAREIARLAAAAGVPWFSTSSLRYAPFLQAMKVPGMKSAVTWGPGPFEPHHYLDLSWYAIHPIEMLYALLGPGCVEVSRLSSPDSDVISARWRDGRTAVVHALRPSGPYGALVLTGKQALTSPPDAKVDYRALVVEIVRFFETRVPPVPNAETLELFAFLDAAQRSKEAGGKPMPLR